MSKKEDLLLLASVAEQSERYEEMAEYAMEFSKLDPKLNVKERNILSEAFKNVVGSRKSACCAITSIEEKEEQKNNHNNVGKLRAYKNKIEQEILKMSTELLTLIEEILIPNSDEDEAKIYYLKMKGDYSRYKGEFTIEEEKATYESKAKCAYEEAHRKAEEKLTATDPLRLGIALNYSAFNYEILHDVNKGCEIAKMAFDEAIVDLDNLDEGTYKESTPIMQLLRDNLTLWISELE